MEDFSIMLRKAMNEGGVKVKALLQEVDVSRTTLSNILNGKNNPDDELQQKLIEGVLNASPKNSSLLMNQILFVLDMKHFQRVGKALVKGGVGNFITRKLDNVFQRAISERDDKENLLIDSSVGNGYAARSVWVSAMDKRISQQASQGVYVVALFDTSGENMYLSIAYAVSDKKEQQLNELVKEPRMKIMDAIEGDPNYEGVIPGPVDLGDTEGTTAERYEPSVIVTKHFRTLELNEDQLIRDINLMLNLFYDFVYEDYIDGLVKQQHKKENNKEENENSKKKKNKKKNTIDTEKYQRLLADRMRHNKIVGEKAEEFLVQKEQERLVSLGRKDLANKIDHVAKRKDGYGYDVVSFEIDEDGIEKEIFIEVKGSSLGHKEDFPFNLTERENEVAKVEKERYYISLVDYVGYSKQRIYDIFKPYDQDDNAQMEMKPAVFKCNYKKKK